jgi:opacity protein-like surface antigen
MLRRVRALRTILLGCVLTLPASLRAEPLGTTVTAIPLSTFAVASAARGCSIDPEIPNEFTRRGAYVGVSGIWAFERFNFEDGRTENGGGLSLRAGYRCHPNAAVEIQGDWLRFDSKASAIRSELDAGAVTGNVRLFPLTSLLEGRIQPYGLVGVGVLATDSENGLLLRLGGGVDLHATPNFALTAGAAYLAPYGSVSRFNTVAVSAGLDYRF